MKYKVKFNNEVDYRSAGLSFMQKYSKDIWRTIVAKNLTLSTNDESTYKLIISLCKSNGYDYEK